MFFIPKGKVANKYSNGFCFTLMPWAAQMAKTEEFMFQNVADQLLYIKLGLLVLRMSTLGLIFAVCFSQVLLNLHLLKIVGDYALLYM